MKGFTLIELMIAISIIGILGGIIFTSLGGTKSKGSDASIQSSMSQLPTLAEYAYDLNAYMTEDMGAQNCLNARTYANTKAAGDAAKLALIVQVSNVLTSAGNASNGGGLARATCAASLAGNTWAVSVPLKTDPTKSWCVDSTGTAKQITGVILTSQCP